MTEGLIIGLMLGGSAGFLICALIANGKIEDIRRDYENGEPPSMSEKP